jgi:hypothetical protein
MSVGALKAAVEDREGIPARDQRLVFGGKELSDDRLLSDYGVRSESTVLRRHAGRSTSQSPNVAGRSCNVDHERSWEREL